MSGVEPISAELKPDDAGQLEDGAHASSDDTFLETPERERKIIAVGGGKGGIGKSLISANIGVHLAQQGYRVIMVDADLGGANLHTCVGMKAPAHTLSDFVTRKVSNLGDVVSPTPIEGLGLISGALDVLAAANPKYTQKLRLLREISRLEVDYVIVDLGGGTGFNILDFFLIADHGILSVIPEPTSIENAYRFIKAVYYRRLKHLQASWHYRPLLKEAIENPQHQNLKAPADLVAYIKSKSTEAGQWLEADLAQLPFRLVVNQARSRQEFLLGEAISRACRKYFGIEMKFLGTIPYDDGAWKSVRQREPLLTAYPDCQAAESIRTIVDGLGLVKP